MKTDKAHRDVIRAWFLPLLEDLDLLDEQKPIMVTGVKVVSTKKEKRNFSQKEIASIVRAELKPLWTILGVGFLLFAASIFAFIYFGVSQ